MFPRRYVLRALALATLVFIVITTLGFTTDYMNSQDALGDTLAAILLASILVIFVSVVVSVISLVIGSIMRIDSGFRMTVARFPALRVVLWREAFDD